MNLHLFRVQMSRIWSMLYLGAVGLLFLAGIGGNAKSIWAQSGPTVIDIGTTVQRSNVRRLGINIGGQTYYDSGQMLRNITFNNPGFEGQQWRSVLTCTAVSGTTCTDGNGWSQWPANFLQGGTFTFIYGAAAGKTGTLVSMTQPSGNGGAPGWYNFGTATPAVGDIFIIQKNMPGLQSAGYGWWPSTSGGATITPETTDLSPETPGVQAVSLNAASGGSANETSYFDTTNGRSFLQMNGTYTIFFRAKGKGGSNELNVSVGRYLSNGSASYFNKTIQLTSQWADYTYTFTANEDGTSIGSAYMSFTASGSTVLLDDTSLTEAANADNPTPFRNAVVDRLRELNPGVLRYMDSGTDFGSTIDNMIAPPFARLRAGFSQGATSSTMAPLGLEEFLELCQAVGAEPWYTMPMGMSPTEAQNLIEFLAGSSSTPYGAKRAALGQTAPWTSVFSTIHLELGDESWNYNFSGDTIGYPQPYGTRAGAIFGAARASASYDASKFDLILNGQAVNPWYGEQAMNFAGNTYDTVDAAPYTFNTFVDYSSNEAIFGSMFAEPEAQDSRPTGWMYQQMEMASGNAPGYPLTGKPANLAVYEVNLSTTQGTAPQNVINNVVPSLGAGLSTAEHMLLMLRDDGVNLQTMFALPEWENGFNNTNGGSEAVQLWGTVIDMGGQSNLCRPQFLAVELANSVVGGTMLAAVQSGGNPTWDENSPNDADNPINITGAHYIQSFAFANGTQNGLILFNLSRTSSLPVTFKGINAPSGTVQVGLLTSANLTDSNESTSKVAITNSTIQNFNPAAITNLPPYSMTVYSWVPGGGAPSPVATTTGLTASPTSITVGQTVTLKATVSSSSTQPTGNVVFTDGGTTLGTVALSSGVASLNVATLAAGSHSITATYDGDTSFGGSTSSAVVVTVSAPALISTTTALTAPASVAIGASATLSATVTPSSGSAATGTVTFLAGQTVLGTASLSSGKASYTISSVSLAAGTYSLTASYGGSTADSSSVSSIVTLTVTGNVEPTTTKLTLSSTQLTEGQSVTAKAVVEASAGSVPSGHVNFYVGASLVGSVVLEGGVAELTIGATLAPGTYQGYASYAGTPTDTASTSAQVSFTVVAPKTPTVTTLGSTTQQIAEGNPVTLTAQVTPQTQGVAATGAVTFYLGQTVLGTGQLAGGQAVLTMSAQFTPGAYQLTAVYAGNGTDQGSTSNPLTLTITPDIVATGIQLSATPTQLTAGQSTVLVAKVTAQAGNAAPTGVVNFYLGQTQVGSTTLISGAGQYTYVANLPPGTYQLTANYVGSSQFNPSNSTPLTITIEPSVLATTTSLTTSASQITQGQTFTLTAVVAPASGSTAPQGTVTFYLGQTQLGTATLAGGKASLTETNSLAPGSYQITAVYAGNAQDSGSTSNVLPITIAPNMVSTTTSLTASASQVTQGQSFTLTAVVAAAGGSTTPQGTVTFYLGQTQIGTATLTGGTATLTESNSLAPGAYQITAAYSGSPQDSASTSSPIALSVSAPIAPQPVATSTAVTVSPQEPTSGQPMQLQVRVAASGSSPVAGTVTLYMGQTSIGSATVSGGTAVVTMQAPQPGTYTATATFAAQGNYAASSATPVTFIVQASSASVPTQPTPPAGSFTLGLSSNSVDLGKSDSASLQVMVAAVQGYSGTVQLSCAGLPAGVNCSFSPAALTINGAQATSTLSFSTTTNNAYTSPIITNVARGILLPWDIIGVLGFISGRKRLRARWSTLVTLCILIFCSTIWMTGCGLTVNSVTRQYQVTVTAVGQNQLTQTTTVSLYVTEPAATF